MPFRDWQFWVSTAVALACAWLLLRAVFPRRGKSECGGCASGAAARRTNAALTISAARKSGQSPVSDT